MFKVRKYYRVKEDNILSHSEFCKIELKNEPRKPRKLLFVKECSSRGFYNIEFEGLKLSGGWSPPESPMSLWEECECFDLVQGEMEL